MKKGRDAQPLSRIEWVHRDDLHANSYNPNKVAKPELELLKVSILEDGWTQPIVARPSEFRLSFPCSHSVKMTAKEAPEWIRVNSHLLKLSPIPLASWTAKDGLPSDLIALELGDAAKLPPTMVRSCASGSETNGALGMSEAKTDFALSTFGISTDSTTFAGSSRLFCPICGSSGSVPSSYWQRWSSGQGGEVGAGGAQRKMPLCDNTGKNVMAKLPRSLPMGVAQMPSCSDGKSLASVSPITGFLRLFETLEIVDGFHRWTVSADPRLYAMTDGFVPVVRLQPPATGDQMLSTIRHNRARGEHGVLPMADIVRRLIDEEGLTPEQVMARCGMEKEEVVRLYDRGGMTERGTQGKEGFSRGWVPR